MNIFEGFSLLEKLVLAVLTVLTISVSFALVSMGVALLRAS